MEEYKYICKTIMTVAVLGLSWKYPLVLLFLFLIWS